MLLPTSNPLGDIVVYMRNRDARFLVLDYARARVWNTNIATAVDGDGRFREVDREKSSGKDLRVFVLEAQ